MWCWFMLVESPFGKYKYLTTREAADLARLHRDSFLRKIRIGEAPQPIRIHQKFLFDRDLIFHWLQTGELELPVFNEETKEKKRGRPSKKDLVLGTR